MAPWRPGARLHGATHRVQRPRVKKEVVKKSLDRKRMLHHYPHRHVQIACHGRAPRRSPWRCVDPLWTDREDLDTAIEDVAKDAAAEAEKTAAEEAARGGAEEAGKATAEGAGKAIAEEAGKAAAEEAGKATAKEASTGSAREAGKAAAEEEGEVADGQPSSSAASGSEVEKLIVQRTQELEQRHREALDAQALVYAGKVKELEAERDGLKGQALRLAEEKDTLNSALTEAQSAILDKAEQLSKANDSIKDLTLKLEALEEMLSEAKAREGTLAKELETERQLRKDEAAIHKDFVDERSGSTRAKLTLFFEVVLGALEQLKSNRESTLADESRRMCLGAMTKVLTKLAFRYPDLDFNDAVDTCRKTRTSLGLRSASSPSPAASAESRGWRASAGTRCSVFCCRCEFMTKKIHIFS
nr:translation initiation factor IF-2-like [Aegilops tauschii subsp. strangulata]